MKKPPDKFWFPSLLQSAINVKSNSWFNISCKYNPNKLTTKKETFKSSYRAGIFYIYILLFYFCLIFL